MILPSPIQFHLDQLAALVAQRPDHALHPHERLALYAALGPTFASASHAERIAQIQADHLPLTRADRVRARLALLSVKRVLPQWTEAMASTSLLSAHGLLEFFPFLVKEWLRFQGLTDTTLLIPPIPLDRPIDPQTMINLDMYVKETLGPIPTAVFQELQTWFQAAQAAPSHALLHYALNPQLAAHRPIMILPTAILPYQALQLADGVLAGIIPPHRGLEQASDLSYNIMGNDLGTDESFPTQAYALVAATAEALYQALGLGPFDRQEVTPTTTDADLEGKGAAAAAAHLAACGIFDGVYATAEFDPLAQQHFWTWWLTEAIPVAWAAEAAAPEAQGPTMPFAQTVRVTAYRYGTIPLDPDADDDGR